ncbi:MAG: MFS transporter [Archangiaceae bacterium]|nr:MFS transporter [Archangiaceae bacterium]
MGESFSNRIRAAVLSVAAAAQWVANFAVSISFPVLAQQLSLQFAYGPYAAFAVLSLGFVWRWVRETKGKELEAIGQ